MVDAELEARDREIERLRHLIRQHIVQLRYQCKDDEEAERIIDRLDRGVRGK